VSSLFGRPPLLSSPLLSDLIEVEHMGGFGKIGFLILGIVLLGCGGSPPAPTAPAGMSVEEQTNVGILPATPKKK
jgi:hypothetical protein